MLEAMASRVRSRTPIGRPVHPIDACSRAGEGVLVERSAENRPILFAYDGSEHAKEAIRQAGEQLRNSRRAIVLSVWQPLATVPFAGAGGVPPVSPGLDQEVKREAARLALEGAELARSTGGRSRRALRSVCRGGCRRWGGHSVSPPPPLARDGFGRQPRRARWRVHPDHATTPHPDGRGAGEVMPTRSRQTIERPERHGRGLSSA